MHRPRGAPSKDNITPRGRNRWFQLEGGATAVWPITLRGKPIISGKRNISFLPYFIIWQISHILPWFCCIDLDYKASFWDNFSIQVKAFGLSSEVDCVLYHLRDLPAYPLHLEQLRWAQPANNSPNNKCKACINHCVSATLNHPLVTCWVCLFTCSWPPPDWHSIFEQNLLNSSLFSPAPFLLRLSPFSVSIGAW